MRTGEFGTYESFSSIILAGSDRRLSGALLNILRRLMKQLRAQINVQGTFLPYVWFTQLYQMQRLPITSQEIEHI
ncbi:MAG: hypothetical protein EA404_00035 [Spirochaetaceae bacterium]|nr:MAG: hypothetical protein EA404_00035 [Spirochaetaceae bacterium]